MVISVTILLLAVCLARLSDVMSVLLLKRLETAQIYRSEVDDHDGLVAFTYTNVSTDDKLTTS